MSRKVVFLALASMVSGCAGQQVQAQSIPTQVKFASFPPELEARINRAEAEGIAEGKRLVLAKMCGGDRQKIWNAATDSGKYKSDVYQVSDAYTGPKIDAVTEARGQADEDKCQTARLAGRFDGLEHIPTPKERANSAELFAILNRQEAAKQRVEQQATLALRNRLLASDDLDQACRVRAIRAANGIATSEIGISDRLFRLCRYGF